MGMNSSNMTPTVNSNIYSSPCNVNTVKAFSQVFIPILYSIVFIVGLVGNGLVVCVLVKYHKRSNLTDVSLFNLAVSDLLFLFSLPFWAHYATVSDWIFGSFMCHAVTAIYMLGFYGSIFFMVLMTVDRYAAIVHAQDFLFSKHRSIYAGIALALLMWTLSLAASLPTIIFTSVQNKTTVQSCDLRRPNGTEGAVWKYASYIEMNVLGWVLPLSVMAFCYSRLIPILMTIKSNKKHKAVMLILIIVIVFFLFWTPYNIVIFMKFLQHLEYMDSCEWYRDLMMAMQYVETIAFTHCCLNPIIYAFMGNKFRTLVRRMLWEWFPFCFCRKIQLGASFKREGSQSTLRSNVFS